MSCSIDSRLVVPIPADDLVAATALDVNPSLEFVTVGEGL